MTRKHIPVEEAAKTWMENPAFRADYDALEDEFALASALNKARGAAELTREQVATTMGTTQAFVARGDIAAAFAAIDTILGEDGFLPDGAPEDPPAEPDSRLPEGWGR